MQNPYVLVMTSCIDPGPNSHKLPRADPLLRLGDYQAALRFWLHLPEPRISSIVYVDNSGFSLDSLKEVAERENPFSRTVEFITSSDNHCPPNVHYGYPELGMIDHVLETSKLIRGATHFIKATGRLTFPRVSALLDRIPENPQFVVETRDFKIGRYGRRFVSTQIAIFDVEFYRSQLLGCRREMIDNGPILVEGLFYKRLMPLRHQPGCILRFPTNCDPQGLGGHGKNYDQIGQSVIRAVRGVGRRIAPWVWI